MKLIITGRHLEITKAFSQYVRKRFKKWATFIGPNTAVHVTVSVEGYRHQVEVTAKDGRYAVTSKQTTKDMYQSVDLLAEKIGRQLMRQHEKLTNVKAASSRAPRERKNAKPQMFRDRESFIKVEMLTTKPMTQDEAVLQLQNQKRNYLVFEDAETGQMAVLERQKNGSLKLVVKE